MGLVLGIDIGTSSTVGVLVDVLTGRVLARHVVPHAPGFVVPEGQPWGAEQDPAVWLDAAMRVTRECTVAASHRRSPVQAVAVSGLYGGLGVPMGREGEVLRRALIWLDRRAVAEAQEVAKAIGVARIREVTGNDVIDPYFGYVKLMWYMAHEPDLFRRTRMLATPSGLIVRALTGSHVTDLTSMAAFGGLLDERTWELDPGMVKDLGAVGSRLSGESLELDPSMFGTIVRSDSVVGPITPTGAALSGLPDGVPVVAGGMDSALAMLASGATQPGDNTLIMGTSWSWGFLRSRGQATRVPRMVSCPYVLRPDDLSFTFGGGAYLGGAAGHWMPQMVTGAPTDTLEREAAMVPPGAGGVTFHPYLMGARAPVWRADVTAAFLGLRAEHHRGHMHRAVLEGAAFLHEECLRSARGAGVDLAPATTVVDAGTGSALWRRIVADVSRTPLWHLAAFPGTGYGAAMLAALGAGLATEDQVIGWVPQPRTVEPTQDPVVLKAYGEARSRFWATHRALHGAIGGA
jgi:xylulokinase